ncbi:barstar family protein [Kitasatospora aureofaciens]|uniref:barstar family protein n=1 Tax=Kitasatospora aureofaciens TaxID=1894 RepID=UPI001C44702B|nr:barstar family protein [Kitasatospora aureofaciens]MBV6703304.1 barstar family protein [Kitasatospora aureofaciens]
MTHPSPPERLLAVARWDLLPGHPWAGLAATPAGDVRRVAVDGQRCRTKADLLTTWAQALAFPGYFGHNWDAFEECLGDVLHPAGDPDRPSARLLVVVTDADALLADAPGAELTTLLRILDAAAVDHLLAVLFAARDPSATEYRLRAAARAL